MRYEVVLGGENGVGLNRLEYGETAATWLVKLGAAKRNTVTNCF